MLYFTWNQNNKPRITRIEYKQPKIILEHIKHNQTHQTHQIQQMEKMYQENHMNHNKQGGKGKETCLALESQILSYLIGPLMPTITKVKWRK